MPKELGAETILVKNELDYFEEDMGQISEQNLFRNGIIKRLSELNFADTENTVLIIDFICSKFTEHNIQIIKKNTDNTRVTIKNWITGKAPNHSEQSRPNVYKLCFALEMDAVQTSEFFLKKYLCRPFNFKDYREAVYYFCLRNNLSYADALRLIDAIAAFSPMDMVEIVETRQLGIELDEITNEKDFLQYMQEHRYSEEKQYETVHSEIRKLLEQCKKLSGTKSTSALLETILGYNDHEQKKGISKSDLPQMIVTNFPSEIKFSEIKKRTASSDTYRKAVVLLFFYKYYASLYQSFKKKGIPDTEINMGGDEALESFEISLDEILERCGYIYSYMQNPYDRFFFYCAKQCNPLEELKNILKKYYLDIFDEETDDDENDT